MQVLVAQRLSAFGVTLLAYDPYVSAARAAQIGVRLVPLDDLLRESDFITIHLPRTSDTERGRAEFHSSAGTTDSRQNPRQGAAGPATQVDQPTRGGQLEASYVAAQLVSTNPGVLSDILAIGLPPKLLHQGGVEVPIEVFVSIHTSGRPMVHSD